FGELGVRRFKIFSIEYDACTRPQFGEALAAEKLIQRHAQGLALQIPQRHVDRAYPETGNPTVAVPPGAIAHDLPQPLDLARILSSDQRREPHIDNDLGCKRRLGKLASALAPSHKPVGCDELHDSDITAVAAIVRLWIVQRKCLNPIDEHASS